MEYQYFDDFKIYDPQTGKSKTLSDFGGIVINSDKDAHSVNLLPDPNHIITSNEMRDGERYIATKYGTRSITVTCFFQGKKGAGDITELAGWIGKPYQRVFSWVGDDENKEIDVVYSKGLDLDVFYGSGFNAELKLTFLAHNPYWRLHNERPKVFKPQINDSILLKNKGNTNSYPLIKITPQGVQGTIKFKWNDLNVELTNVNQPIYLDCEKNRCYEIVEGKPVLRLTKFKSDEYFSFPELLVEKKNFFTLLQGDISELSIDFRTRII